MKKLILSISLLLLLSLGVFGYLRWTRISALGERTIITQMTFQPNTGQGTRLGETQITSLDGKGGKVVEHINVKGEKLLYFSHNGKYLKHKEGASENSVIGVSGPVTNEIIVAREQGLYNHPEFVRVDTVNGLKCFVLIRRNEKGQTWTQWVNPELGLVKYEKQHDNGVERLDIVSVVREVMPINFRSFHCNCRASKKNFQRKNKAHVLKVEVTKSKKIAWITPGFLTLGW